MLGDAVGMDELAAGVLDQSAAVPRAPPGVGQVAHISASGGHVLLELAPGDVTDLLADGVDLPPQDLESLAELLEAGLLPGRRGDEDVHDLTRRTGPDRVVHGLTGDQRGSGPR